MSLVDEISEIIKHSANEVIAYEIILPSAKSMAKTIASLANTNGGHLIIGISKEYGFKGLSNDFNSDSITKKALELLVPGPKISMRSITINFKNLFVIKVDKSNVNILLQDKKYILLVQKFKKK